MKDKKPCPFCGGTASLYYQGYYKTKYINGIMFFVKCDFCGSQGQIFRTKDDVEKMPDWTEHPLAQNAIEAWNRRTGIEVNQEDNERIQVKGFSRRIS